MISNAVKFTEEGRVVLKVKMERRRQSLHFLISDTGIGISQRDLKTIFYEFRQLKGVNSKKSKGSGLGLALVRKNLDLLGGDINVTSEMTKVASLRLYYR